ncbi:Mitochondrial carnitine carrier [Neolecta irregularis DAH-3]|uniref:Mitochondrial carnitine carrier n=1 Tax=Neolecta irregularis (strain DAH-3) TaxID=1198029 RepID=A0A1U7LT04_NEOID|nr:Mitochondrial carnitine carrier [Neolecta irregularis DAH-3]|eukprot:OLL25759.1 Mitochondrial carnitine carrier [Neolecta irregularis DAH-3]
MDNALTDISDVNALVPAFSGLKSFLAGGVGGICSVIVGHPFDLIKVRLQTAEKGVYKGTMDAVSKTMSRNGLRGLYAGVTPPLLGVTPIFAVSFWGYDVGKGLVRRTSSVPESGFTIPQMAAAGFFSAIPTTILTAPFERVKVLLQIQGQSAEKKYNGTYDVLRQLYREGGLRSSTANPPSTILTTVFRGSFATLARDGPGSAAYFAAYEVVKEKLTPVSADGSKGDLSVPAIIAAGGTAGMAMWLCVFPLDTIKSQLQSGTESSIVKVCSNIYARGGVKAFFPGLGPALLRAYPANAATFLGVELTKQFLDSTF